MALFVLLISCMLVVLFWITVGAGIRSKAQAAADAAALAGAVSGNEASERVAVANSAKLVSFKDAGRDVYVKVSYRGISAGAAARNETPNSRSELAPAIRAAVGRAEEILRARITILGSRSGSVAIAQNQVERLAAVSASSGLCRVSGNVFQICQRD